MIRQLSNRTIILLLVLISALFFIPFLGNVHLFDWDEINFAESAREMIVTNNYLTVQIDYQPFWEKPPLFIWIQVLSMKIFGINEFAARFPNAVCGILTIVILFLIGKRIKDKQLGLLWALFYAGSLLPFFYFKSGIIDPWFNLFIFLGIYFGYAYFTIEKKRAVSALMAGTFIGLAILTKGPVGLLIFGLSTGIYVLIKKFRVFAKFTHILWFLSALIFVGGFWFILQIVNGNMDVVIDFINYQIHLFQTKDAGHGGFLMYHFVVLLIGVFPASVIAIPVLFGNKNTAPELVNFKMIMQITLWTVLILFTIVSTKIVHYSSMCYFPITFLAAYHLHNMIIANKKFTGKLIPLLFLTIGILLSILLIVFPLVDAMKEKIIARGWIKDPFAIEQFKAEINWIGFEWVVGIIMLAAVIYGWIQLKKHKLRRFAFVLPTFMTVYFMALLFYVPRVEEYTQNVFIEFLKDKQHEDCYVETQTMKSYAKLFYTRKMPPDNQKSYNKQWLKKGDIDKPVYFVIRNKKAEKFAKLYPQFNLIKSENGYAFFVRYPNDQ
jgi:4-amino-4-deoxy-L-arabinose transferase-like glycosyltransferase